MAPVVPPPEPLVSNTPRCPPHQRPAVATCVRCGTFLCGECTELLGEAATCASCLPLLRAHGSASLPLKLAFGLCVAAMMSSPLALLLPLHVKVEPERALIVLPLLRRLPVLNVLAAGVGGVLASRELRRLGPGGRSSPAGSLARWTRALAWLNLGFVLLQGFLVLRLVLGLRALASP
ncbi:hypothetical protein BON30_34950 [Cystobacter ferrugineus]|uniref:Uncharacterized protein n=1 Tax=Cystobacter ferrugineus TaxID=83449 RepID=A0A1L9B296_9BACT|nr:hypothetical protein BON30_34950 [Cystobacter ferrugineus]